MVLTFAVLLTAVGAVLGGDPTATVKNPSETTPSVTVEPVVWKPLAYDPSKAPPQPKSMTADEWFTYVGKMHEREGIFCKEERQIDAVFDDLRVQMQRKERSMSYERILGGLYHIDDAHMTPWYGFCMENVNADGTPDPHPLKPGFGMPEAGRTRPLTRHEKYTARIAKQEAVKYSPPPVSGVPRVFGQVRTATSLINTCQCDCNTKPKALGKDDPYSCTCHCPPARMTRGPTGPGGVDGPSGEAGKRGVVGARGPAGPAGELPPGEYPMDSCSCYHERTDETMSKLGWTICSKPGFLITGLWRESHETIDSITYLRCCRPCLKIEKTPPPAPKIRYATRYHNLHDIANELKSDSLRSIYFSSPTSKSMPGYCNRLLHKFSRETNARTCYHKGATTDIAYRYVIKVKPAETHLWKFRLGADFAYGGEIYVDGDLVRNRKGRSMWWNLDWRNKDGVLSSPNRYLAAGEWHKIEFYGLTDREHARDGGAQVMEVNFGKGWLEVNNENLAAGCAPDS